MNGQEKFRIGPLGKNGTLLLVGVILISGGILGYALWQDTDDDGVSGYDELVYTLQHDGFLNPLNGDTSGDGIGDGEALDHGLDPTREYAASFAAVFNAVDEEHQEDVIDAFAGAGDQKYPEEFYDALVAAEQNNLDVDKLISQVLERGPSPGEVTDFEERQLELAVDAPEKYQREILANGSLHLTDWDKDGGPQTLPNGSAGIDDTPFDPNRDGDAFVTWFYNEDGEVYADNGTYVGFQPGQGDHVGELGDRNGDGTLAPYFNGTNPLSTQRMDTVLWQDWIEGKDHSSKLGPEGKELVQKVFSNAPVTNPDGTNGVQIHFIDGQKIPHEPETKLEENPMRTMPDELKGPVNYMIYVHSMERDAGGIGIGREPTYGGIGAAPYDDPKWKAGLGIEEPYGHMIGDLINAEEDEKTLMAPGTYHLRLKQDEWRPILNGMSAVNRTYYSSIGS